MLEIPTPRWLVYDVVRLGAKVAEQAPRVQQERAYIAETLDRLEALERSGAKLIFGHDPEFWKSVPQGPAPLF